MAAVEEATLVVRATGGCSTRCSFCPWDLPEEGPFLRSEALEVTIDALLGSRFRPETYFICPDPLTNPGLRELIKSSVERGLKTVIFVPAGTLSGEDEWNSLLLADEVFIFSYRGEALERASRLVRFLVTRGSIPKLLELIPPGARLEDLESAISQARKWGLELWISPPVLCPVSICPVDVVRLLKSWGFHVTEPIGDFMGIYRVRIAFKGDYHMRVAEGPICRRDCRLLFLGPEGLIGKCPAGTLSGVSSPMEFAMLVRRGCTDMAPRASYSFVTSVKLVTKDGKEVDERDLDLLVLVEEAGSLSGAARMAGLSPPSVLRRIRRIEEVLGIKLLISKRGGIDRGGALLTPEARELVRRYRAVKSTSSVLSRFD